MPSIEELAADLTDYDVALLELVKRDIASTGECYASRSRIARELGCCKSTVMNVVERLESKGILSGPENIRRMGGDEAVARFAPGPALRSGGE